MFIVIAAFIVLSALSIVYQTVTGNENNIFHKLIELFLLLIEFIFTVLGKAMLLIPFIGGLATAIFLMPVAAQCGILFQITVVLFIIAIFGWVYNRSITLISFGFIIILLPFLTNFIFGSINWNGTPVNIDWLWNVTISTVTISIGICLAQVGKVNWESNNNLGW